MLDAGAKAVRSKGMSPLPTTVLASAGEGRRPIRPPWPAEHLWNSQRHLVSTLDSRRNRLSAVRVPAVLEDAGVPDSPFLKKKQKKTKHLYASFLDRPKRTHVKSACPPPPSQAGPLPASVTRAGCLRCLPFCLASKGGIKQNRKTAQSRF